MGSHPAGADVGQMALYNLSRAQKRMAELSNKPRWELSDTEGFDCMHYLGNAAIDNAARKLGLKPGDRVVDIGSGFGATGRYLHRMYGADVTGIELQTDIHRLAETINERNALQESVRSVNMDFLQLDLDQAVDHIVSFLCFLHIPDRCSLFRKVARSLKLGGKIYIEDYYARTHLDNETGTLLRDFISCPFLPTSEQYVQDLQEAGFSNIQFQGMSEEWSAFVRSRAISYKSDPAHEPSLAIFYDTVDALFAGGHVGGCRVVGELTKK